MANGQVVLVTTQRLEGGPPLRVVYYVAEENPTKAEAIVSTLMAPNESVVAWGPLPEAAVKALGLKRGEFTHFPWLTTANARDTLQLAKLMATLIGPHWVVDELLPVSRTPSLGVMMELEVAHGTQAIWSGVQA